MKGFFRALPSTRSLRESGQSQDDALGRIDRAFDQLFAGDVKQMKRIGRLRFALLFFRVLLKTFMRKYPAEGWTIDGKERPPRTENPVRHDDVLDHATLSSLEAPELTAAFCRVDDLIYSTMSRYVSWQRTTTIASGSASCDFCFASTKGSTTQRRVR